MGMFSSSSIAWGLSFFKTSKFLKCEPCQAEALEQHVEAFAYFASCFCEASYALKGPDKPHDVSLTRSHAVRWEGRLLEKRCRMWLLAVGQSEAS